MRMRPPPAWQNVEYGGRVAGADGGFDIEACDVEELEQRGWTSVLGESPVPEISEAPRATKKESDR